MASNHPDNAEASRPPSSSVTVDNEGDEKVKVQFLAVGGAPILKKNKFQVRSNMTVAEVVAFLRKTLKIRDGDPLFVYLNSSFAPSLDQTLKSLHDCFEVSDELFVQYAVTSSWG
jgi:ubiquitin-like protein ATG12